MESKIEKFSRWEKMSRDTIDVKRCYIDIAGDLIAGILLSQIIFWFLPKANGATKLRVKNKDGTKCLAKNRKDWLNECRIKGRQYDRAMKILKVKKLVSVRNGMFNGKRTPFIKLNWDVLIQEMDELELETQNNDTDNERGVDSITPFSEIGAGF